MVSVQVQVQERTSTRDRLSAYDCAMDHEGLLKAYTLWLVIKNELLSFLIEKRRGSLAVGC